MDLALELGMPYEQLAQEMTENEFIAWHIYAHTRMLPTRRLELYLAQLTYHVARAGGTLIEGTTVLDFLIDTRREEEPINEEEELKAAIVAFKFNPRRKKEPD